MNTYSKIRVAVFSCQAYDQLYLEQAATEIPIDWVFIDTQLCEHTAGFAKDCDAVSVFVNDQVSGPVVDQLVTLGIKHIALRCAGYNNVDIDYAKQRGMVVSHVPAYSPEAVAEHTVALILALNRKLHKAYNRVKEDNFDLNGLLGFNLTGKTVGIVGVGRIGRVLAKILLGFGCRVLCRDLIEDIELSQAGVSFVSLEQLIEQSDIISLHCPLTQDTHQLINNQRIAAMKKGVMLINTSRGQLIDTKAVIDAIKSKHIGYLGLDVYEMEEELFFKDRSEEIISDDVFQRLLTFPNVLITGHQGFFTREALANIGETTCQNLLAAYQGKTNSITFL